MKTFELRESSAPYLTDLVKMAQSEEPIVIESEGKPIAVLVPYERYQQMLAHLPPASRESSRDVNFERNGSGYLSQRDQLVKTHHGRYVAFHDSELVDSDANETMLLKRVYAKYGYGKLLIHLVEESERVYHIPGPRLVRS